MGMGARLWVVRMYEYAARFDTPRVMILTWVCFNVDFFQYSSLENGRINEEKANIKDE